MSAEHKVFICVPIDPNILIVRMISNDGSDEMGWLKLTRYSKIELFTDFCNPLKN